MDEVDEVRLYLVHLSIEVEHIEYSLYEVTLLYLFRDVVIDLQGTTNGYDIIVRHNG